MFTVVELILITDNDWIGVAGAFSGHDILAL